MTLLNSLISTKDRQITKAENAAETAANDIPAVKPYYEIRESADAWGITAHLPGVDKAGLELTIDQHEVRISGKRSWKAPESWTGLYRESSNAPYELVLEHGNSVNAEGVQAELKNGILQVSLPKISAVKPRKISVS